MDLVVGKTYWCDIGVVEMTMTLTHIYKNGRVRIVHRNELGELMSERKCLPGDLVEQVNDSTGHYRLSTRG